MNTGLSHQVGRFGRLGLALVSVVFLGGAGEGGCGAGLDNRKGEPGIDVGGVKGAGWSVNYEPKLTVVVKGAAGIVSQKDFTVGAGGSFVVDGATIDLKEHCARSEIACPQDIFPAEVTMTQPGNERHLLYVTYNRKGPFATYEQTTLLGNVDSDNDFSIALGVGAAAAGNCGLLGVSYATGRITPDILISTFGRSLKGEIVTSYSGACVVAGKGATAGAGLTVEFKLPFSAVRKN